MYPSLPVSYDIYYKHVALFAATRPCGAGFIAVRKQQHRLGQGLPSLCL